MKNFKILFVFPFFLALFLVIISYINKSYHNILTEKVNKIVDYFRHKQADTKTGSSLDKPLLCWDLPCDSESIFAEGLSENMDFRINPNELKKFLNSGNPLAYNEKHSCYAVDVGYCIRISSIIFSDQNSKKYLHVLINGNNNMVLDMRDNNHEPVRVQTGVQRFLTFLQIENKISLFHDTGFEESGSRGEPVFYEVVEIGKNKKAWLASEVNYELGSFFFWYHLIYPENGHLREILNDFFEVNQHKNGIKKTENVRNDDKELSELFDMECFGNQAKITFIPVKDKDFYPLFFNGSKVCEIQIEFEEEKYKYDLKLLKNKFIENSKNK